LARQVMDRQSRKQEATGFVKQETTKQRQATAGLEATEMVSWAPCSMVRGLRLVLKALVFSIHAITSSRRGHRP
jgi:hypothetical protein